MQWFGIDTITDNTLYCIILIGFNKVLSGSVIVILYHLILSFNCVAPIYTYIYILSVSKLSRHELYR